MHDGVYILEDEGSMNKTVRENSCLKTTSIDSDNKIHLWHLRLGHPTFHYLQHLFPKLFINKNPSFFKCEICALAMENHFH